MHIFYFFKHSTIADAHIQVYTPISINARRHTLLYELLGDTGPAHLAIDKTIIDDYEENVSTSAKSKSRT